MSISYLYGDCRPAVCPILTAQAVAVGDLLCLSSGNCIRAEDISYASAVATPSAPTVAASAATRGTALTNAATGVKVSIQFPWGEGALSNAGSATPTAAFGLKVTLAALPAPGLYWNVYVEDSAGSGTYKLQQITTVSAGIIYVDSYGTGQAPPTAVASAAQEITQYNFAQAFVGVSAQTKKAATARAYGNSLDNLIRVDGDGVFSVDLGSATTLVVGDLLAPVANGGGTALVTQSTVKVVHESLAVFRVVEAGTSLTTAKARIIGRKTSGGII